MSTAVLDDQKRRAREPFYPKDYPDFALKEAKKVKAPTQALTPTRRAKAIISVSPSDNTSIIQGKINSANAGDTVVFADGDYNSLGRLNCKTGVSWKGSGKVKLNFVTGTSEFAVNLASNLTIDGFIIRANCGIFYGQGLGFVNLTNNDMQWGNNGVYYNRHAVRIFGGNQIVIEHNYFHDSPSSDRTCDVWDLQNSSISYNKYVNVNDGGHMDGLSVNNKFNYNHQTRVKRMGFEWQDHGHWQAGDVKGSNNQCIGNVFDDPDRVFADTFALSIMMQGATGTVIRKNFLRMNALSFQTPSGWPRRGGIGIEAGGSGGIIVEENIIVNPGGTAFEVGSNTLTGKRAWVQGITYSMKNTIMRNNKFYGDAGEWGHSGAEGGADGGSGSLNSTASVGNQYLPISQAPPTPTAESIGAGITGTITPPPPPPPPTGAKVTNIKVPAEAYDRVPLTWDVTGIGEIVIERIRTGDMQPEGPPLKFPSGSTSGEDSIAKGLTQDHITNTWKFRYRQQGGTELSNEVQVGKKPPVTGGDSCDISIPVRNGKVGVTTIIPIDIKPTSVGDNCDIVIPVRNGKVGSTSIVPR